MNKHLRNLIASLLMLALLIGMVPSAFAVEPTEPTIVAEVQQTSPTPAEESSSTQAANPETIPSSMPAEAEQTVPETTEAVTSQTEPPTESSEEPSSSTVPPEISESVPQEDVPPEDVPTDAEDDALFESMAEYGVVSNVKFFDLAKPNYTTYLSRQISVTYRPNGTGASKTAYIKNLGWHFARIGNTAYEDDPLYCIEPHKNFAASTQGNFVDRDLAVDGSGSSRGAGVWYDLPLDRREAITLTLLFSDQMWDDSISVKNTPMSSNPNTPLRVATQFLIYEITMGLRDPVSFRLNDSNGYTSGDVFYNAGVSDVPGFESCYNSLVSKVQSAKVIPSFTSANSATAPVLSLQGDSITVTDSNGVLGNFSISNGNGAAFSKSGNNLTIRKTGSIQESTVFSLSRYLPSANNSSVAIWYPSSSKYQTCVSLFHPSGGYLNAYFKIKAPSAGSLSLKKQTEDGLNLAGWQFGIYKDAHCTQMISGPHTTDASGSLQVADLAPGTVWIKELGHTNSGVQANYICQGANPKQVAIQNGHTSAVQFYNKLNEGALKIIKATNTGKDLKGWVFKVSDISGKHIGDFTTDEQGVIEIQKLKPGKYVIQEKPAEDPYWRIPFGVHTLDVQAGNTTVDTWKNVLQGLCWFHKETNTGTNLGGWQISIFRDEACTDKLNTVTTREDGKIGLYLDPGIYYAKETGNENGIQGDEYWQMDETVHKFEILPHQDTSLVFKNTHYGKLKIIKVMDTDGPLDGWKFNVTDAEGNVLPGSPFTSNAQGEIICEKVLPGTYTVEELIPQDSLYHCKDKNPQTITVKQGETAEVRFHNALRPGKISIQKVDATGEPLAGAKFQLLWSQDGHQWTPVSYSDKADVVLGGCSNPSVQDGCLTTGKDGLITWEHLYPGIQYRIFEIEAPEGYSLLADAAFQGELPAENLTVSLRVVNTPSFLLPKTGSSAVRVLSLTAALCCMTGLILCFSHRKKR